MAPQKAKDRARTQSLQEWLCPSRESLERRSRHTVCQTDLEAGRSLAVTMGEQKTAGGSLLPGLACLPIKRTSECGLRQVIGAGLVWLLSTTPSGTLSQLSYGQTKPLCERLELCKETVKSGKDGLEKKPESRIPVSQTWIPTPSDRGDIPQWSGLTEVDHLSLQRR